MKVGSHSQTVDAHFQIVGALKNRSFCCRMRWVLQASYPSNYTEFVPVQHQANDFFTKYNSKTAVLHCLQSLKLAFVSRIKEQVALIKIA